MSVGKLGSARLMPYVPSILTGEYPDIGLPEGASVQVVNPDHKLQNFRPLDRVPAVALQASAQPRVPEIVAFDRANNGEYYDTDLSELEVEEIMKDVQALRRQYSLMQEAGTVKRIILVADRKGPELEVGTSLRKEEEGLAKMLGRETGKLPKSEAILRFNPDFMDQWDRRGKIQALAHELSHVWCDRAFPEHSEVTDELRSFRKIARDDGTGFWAINVLVAHSHLFLRYQLLRKGDYDFVVRDMLQLQESYDRQQPKNISVSTLMPFIVGGLVDFAGTNRLIGDQKAVDNVARWAARFIDDRVENKQQAQVIFDRCVYAASILFYQMCHDGVPRAVLPYDGVAFTLGSARAWEFEIDPPFAPVNPISKQLLSPRTSNSLPAVQGKAAAELPSGSKDSGSSRVIDVSKPSQEPMAPTVGQRFMAIFSKGVRADVKQKSAERAKFKKAERAERKLREQEEPVLKLFAEVAEVIDTYLTQQRGMPAGRDQLFETQKKFEKFYYANIMESGRDDLNTVYHLLRAQLLLYRYKDFPWRGIFFGLHEVGEDLAAAKMLAARSEIPELIALVEDMFQQISVILGNGRNMIHVDAHFDEDGHPVASSTHTASF